VTAEAIAMDIRPLSHAVAVSPQLQPEDLEAARARGFRSILCNRPDQEEPGQPPFEVLAQAADAAGLVARYQPIRPGQIGPADVAEFQRSLAELPGPVLAYCRTGTRCATLWARAQTEARSMTRPEVLQATRNAGYELQGL
jgi:sulfide:quinone oxidoreductase